MDSSMDEQEVTEPVHAASTSSAHQQKPITTVFTPIATGITVDDNEFDVGDDDNPAASFSIAFVSRLAHRRPTSLAAVSEQVWTHYENNKQDARMYEWKQNVLAHLAETIEFAFPNLGGRLYATGSTVNGCGAYNADADVCLLLPDDCGRVLVDRRYAVEGLRALQEALLVCETGKRLVYRAQFISAKVPILRLLLRKPYDVIEVDVNINNIEGIYNSHLCRHYAMLDPRFPALALLIKHWAIKADVNNPYDGTLNSYSLILLLLHHLQLACRPPVLPDLFAVLPQHFDDRLLPVDRLDEIEVLPSAVKGLGENRQTVAELLAGFFAYYHKFDFDRWAISIRPAALFPRSRLPPSTLKYGVYIEEPYDRENTARSVLNPDLVEKSNGLHKIRAAFKSAHQVFADVLESGADDCDGDETILQRLGVVV